jgi:UDP-2,4-diacetamido-2,4,6-trideoxy-beta-L-altropyranose hydrolase
MLKLVFRVDSSHLIGTGHVVRCITLAKLLSQKIQLDCTFVARDLQGSISDIIVESGFKLIELQDDSESLMSIGYSDWLGSTPKRDADQTMAALRAHNLTSIDIFIVDHYSLDVEWETRFKVFCNKFVVIDDLANRIHTCDYLIDQNIAPNYLNRYKKLVPNNCKLFLGISYCLLNDDFFSWKNVTKTRTKVTRLLVFFGGVDINNSTLKLLHVIEDRLMLFENVNIVVGRSNPNKFEVEKFCSGYINCTYNEQISNMAELMVNSDLAIGAGGATTGERIFLGLPSIVFSLADNQVEVARYLHRLNYIDFIGDESTITNKCLDSVLDAYISAPETLEKRSSQLLKLSTNRLNQLVTELLN